MEGCRTVIHLVGSTREEPWKGITFEKLQVEGTRNMIREAQRAGLGRERGERNNRTNPIPAGPTRTLAASRIKDFLDLLHNAAEKAPLRRNVTQEEVANVAAFLGSSLSSGMTGQVVYVDCGYHIWA